MSAVDRRVDWERVNLFGGAGIGRGPVYAGLGGSDGQFTTQQSQAYPGPWFRGKLFWYVAPSYRGLVLIRGRRLDGSESLRFGDAKRPSSELHIGRQTTVSWTGQPRGSRGVPSAVRIHASGCYGVQIDGASFSRRIVFAASTP